MTAFVPLTRRQLAEVIGCVLRAADACYPESAEVLDFVAGNLAARFAGLEGFDAARFVAACVHNGARDA